MMLNLVRVLLLPLMALFSSSAFAAADSYRWLHVTIDTPWAIFIFLLPMVMLPPVLMAILYWRFSGKKTPAVYKTASPNKSK